MAFVKTTESKAPRKFACRLQQSDPIEEEEEEEEDLKKKNHTHNMAKP